MRVTFKILSHCFPMVVLLGCVSTTGHVGVFSKAAEELAGQLEMGYQLEETSTIKRKIVNAAVDPKKLSDDTFKGLLEGSKEYKIRMKMIKQLRAYSKALGELSSANFRGGRDRQCIQRTARRSYRL